MQCLLARSRVELKGSHFSPCYHSRVKDTPRERKKRGAQESRRVSSGAMRSVWAILLVALAGFLVLASFNIGGVVGSAVYSTLSTLFGVGYMLLPLSLFLLAVAIIRSLEKHFGIVQLLGMLVFLLSSLGLVNMAFPGRGGFIGIAVAEPIVAAVDTTAAVVFLIAFCIIALVIAFDIHLGSIFSASRNLFGRFFTRTEKEHEEDLDEVPVGGLVEQEVEPEEAAPEQPPEEEREERPVRVFQQKAGTITEGFPIIAATGGEYSPPPIIILSKNKGKPEVGDVKANMNIIKRTLQNFGIQVEMDEATIGPTVTRYAMKPAEGVRLSKIVALQSNLELALAASPVRIEAPIPGKSLVGVEVPNIARTTLGLAPLLSDEEFVQSDKPLYMALGRSITGQPHFADLARMPHLLVAGTTGAGKSVAIHDFVVSLLYRCGPQRLRFIMVDPKRVELTVYNSIPHLLTPVITDAKKAILAMKWLGKEMARRYNILEAEGVRDIAAYHEAVVAPALERHAEGDAKPLPEAMPYIVLVIDELADIMSAYQRELEAGIVRLAQMSRAVGIHLILSTQRPSVKVITGLIKANIPARVALHVASQIDSRTILDMGGAEKLLGAGDMLFLSSEMSKPRRIQAPYISDSEVKKVVSHVAKQGGDTLRNEIDLSESKGVQGGLPGLGSDPIFTAALEEEDGDDLYPEAKRTVVEAGKASTSYLQRKLGVGYARAARLIDLLEERGVIGPGDGAKPREVIGMTAVDNVDNSGNEGDNEEA